MKVNRGLVFVSLMFLALVSVSRAVDAPDWEFEFEPSEKVSLANVKWHEKDYGWLLTARLSTKSRYTIRPITYLRFEGLNTEEEVVWEGSKVIRRKDLSGSIGGQMNVFVRVFFKNVPTGVVAVKAHFENVKVVEEE